MKISYGVIAPNSVFTFSKTIAGFIIVRYRGSLNTQIYASGGWELSKLTTQTEPATVTLDTSSHKVTITAPSDDYTDWFVISV